MTVGLGRTQTNQLKNYSYTIRDFGKWVQNEYIKINSLARYKQLSTRKTKMEEKKLFIRATTKKQINKQTLGINLTSDLFDP